MKQYYILLFFLLTYISNSAQTITLYNDKGMVITDTSVVVKGSANDALLQYKVRVGNRNTSSIAVRVSQTLVFANSHSNYSYNWGKSYSNPAAGQTSEAIVVAAGAAKNEFVFQYRPENQTGTSRFTFIFFDEKNPDNFTFLTLKFVVTAPASDANSAVEYVSALYPNPANTYTTISYNVNKNAKINIRISNVIGVEVKTIEVKPNSGKFTIDTSKLKAGAYLFSFLVNDKALKTSKLIISK